MIAAYPPDKEAMQHLYPIHNKARPPWRGRAWMLCVDVWPPPGGPGSPAWFSPNECPHSSI
jgi:hypothetical protein